MVDFLVMAIDQAGNPQEAIWSVMQKNENEDSEVSDVSYWEVCSYNRYLL